MAIAAIEKTEFAYSVNIFDVKELLTEILQVHWTISGTIIHGVFSVLRGNRIITPRLARLRLILKIAACVNYYFGELDPIIGSVLENYEVFGYVEKQCSRFGCRLGVCGKNGFNLWLWIWMWNHVYPFDEEISYKHVKSNDFMRIFSARTKSDAIECSTCSAINRSRIFRTDLTIIVQAKIMHYCVITCEAT